MTDESVGLIDDMVTAKPAANESVVAAGVDNNVDNIPANPVGPSVSSVSSGDDSNGGGAVGVGTVDKSGTTYDPTIHEKDPKTGGPVLTTKGMFRRKRGGGAGRTATAPTPPVLGLKPEDYRNAAAFLCGITFNATAKLMGESWRPDPTERATIEDNAAKTLEYYKVDGFAPPVMLCLAIGMYAFPRMDAEAKARIRVIGERIGLVKKRPPNRAAEPAAPAPLPTPKPVRRTDVINPGGYGTPQAPPQYD